MHRLLYLSLLLLTACTSTINDDYIKVDSATWQTQYNTPYPFTTYGEIVCSLDEVYFYPDSTGMNEASIPLPLNQTAIDTLAMNHLVPTVNNAIRPDADLTDAIKIGLDYCKANNYQRPTQINK